MNCEKCIKFGICDNKEKDELICVINKCRKVIQELQDEFFNENGDFKFMEVKNVNR